jgi:hypothetical protein
VKRAEFLSSDKSLSARPWLPTRAQFWLRASIFVLDPPETLWRLQFWSECYCEERRWGAALPDAQR